MLSLPNERNFRTIDTESDTFQNRFAAVTATKKAMDHFGFKPVGTENRYLVLELTEKNALSMIEAAVNDLDSIIHNLSEKTPIAKATSNLLKRNPRTAASVVEKIQAAIQRVLEEPHEMKYHKIRLDKLFKQIGPVDGGFDFIELFGFKVDVVNQVAKLTYPGLDVELLKLRFDDLSRSWQDALTAFKQKKIQSGVKKMQIDEM